jgi:Phosphotransferase enzyme family
MRDRAIAAALAVARAHGLPCDAPVVLQDRCNLLLHLAPSPVVARVATETASARGDAIGAFFAREVAMGLHLAAAGAPSVPPATKLPPGPHWQDGLCLTFWRWVPHDPDRPLNPAELGRSLRAVHTALADFDGEVAPFDPLGEATRLLDKVEAAGAFTADELSPMRRAADQLRHFQAECLSGPVQAVHGDAHRANVLRTPAGLLWNDYEDTVCAPVEWDLACLVAVSRTWGPVVPEVEEALQAYGPHDATLLASMIELRALLVAAWTLFMGDRDAESRARAKTRLAWWHSVHL